MGRKIAIAFVAASIWIVAPRAWQGQTPATSAEVPKTTATTPAACSQEVRDYANKRTQEITATLPPMTPATDQEQALAQQRARSAALAPVTAARTAMLKDCVAKFDVQTVSEADLPGLIQLYSDAAMLDKAKAAVERALPIKTMNPDLRSATLAMAITTILREEKSDARNARLETIMAELDAMPQTYLDKKFDSHFALLGYYRYDDLDAPIIKHSTWVIDTIKETPVELRKRYASRAVSAYVDMAEAWAGQGKNDEAIALLNRAAKDLPDVPTAANSVKSEVERLQLVGTSAAPLKAPRWLNMPAGQTELAMPGKVTLLEFSAHWCVPCKESYPGVNRLLEKYGPKGFRVVLGTRLYGYFEAERNLSAEDEFARDKKYFAEHGMNVPIAVGDLVTVKVVSGKVEYLPAPDPNDTSYKVGGIPQIHLIDKKGNIRLVMVGYDDANEAKLAKMIEDMLKEK